ncbi:hypothetical protein BER93_14650 [Xanthomonas fragariae]|nr:hypothetical protein BER92_14615 [Xanthomonas fragariae]AOD19126.1 hypothetical protein BER93_14650 [Xanthomonas fragariae]
MAARYTLLVLLTLSSSAQAWHPQYSPWPQPPAGSQCKAGALQPQEGSPQWVGSAPPKRSAVQRGKRCTDCHAQWPLTGRSM